MATHSSIRNWKDPMDRGTWRAIVHGVAKRWTWLSTYASIFMHCHIKNNYHYPCSPMNLTEAPSFSPRSPPNTTIVVVFAITVPSSLWAYHVLLFFLLSLLLWLSLTFASLHEPSQDCPVSNSWLLQAPPLEGAAELAPVSLCSVLELPSLLLAGVDKGPRRQKGKDFLSPILLARVLGSSAV